MHTYELDENGVIIKNGRPLDKRSIVEALAHRDELSAIVCRVANKLDLPYEHEDRDCRDYDVLLWLDLVD